MLRNSIFSPSRCRSLSIKFIDLCLGRLGLISLNNFTFQHLCSYYLLDFICLDFHSASNFSEFASDAVEHGSGKN